MIETTVHTRWPRLRVVRSSSCKPSHTPLDVVVKKVIQKYQASTCRQLTADKAAPPSDIEKRVVQMMQQDPKLRAAFLDQVAAPIANKVFECGW